MYKKYLLVFACVWSCGIVRAEEHPLVLAAAIKENQQRVLNNPSYTLKQKTELRALFQSTEQVIDEANKTSADCLDIAITQEALINEGKKLILGLTVTNTITLGLLAYAAYIFGGAGG